MSTTQGTGYEKQVSEAWLSECNEYNGRMILRDYAQNLNLEVDSMEYIFKKQIQIDAVDLTTVVMCIIEGVKMSFNVLMKQFAHCPLNYVPLSGPFVPLI